MNTELHYSTDMNTLLIFDLDGTLADSREDLTTAVNLTREYYGMPAISVDDVADNTGDGKKKLIERCLADCSDYNIDEAVEKFSFFYHENLTKKTRLYEGVAEGIRSLHKKGIKLAVLSNKPGDMSRKLLDHLKISQYFFKISGGGDVKMLKPAPDGIYDIIKTAEFEGLNSENIYMVGDNYTDIEAAANSRIKSIFCNYGFGSYSGVRPDYSIDDFASLESIVLN